MLIGSQAILNINKLNDLVAAIDNLSVPVYLSGMARGMLGRDHPLQLRHKRKNALREADLILLAGVPCDFRLDYGRHINSSAAYISVNRSRKDLYKNKRPRKAILADPGHFLIELAASLRQPHPSPPRGGGRPSAMADDSNSQKGTEMKLSGTAENLRNDWNSWLGQLKESDQKREKDIEEQAMKSVDNINPIELFKTLDPLLNDNSILVAEIGRAHV